MQPNGPATPQVTWAPIESPSPPAVTVPLDVLLYIFTCLQGMYIKFSYDWIVVTQVCWRWRLAALESPGMWTHLSTRLSLPFATLIINRSLAVPLEVYIFEKPSAVGIRVTAYGTLRTVTPTSPLTKVDLLALEQMHRIRNLIVQRSIPSNVDHLFSTPAPKLERFTNIFTSPKSSSDSSSVKSSTILPPEVGPLISLTLSSLGSARFPWKSFPPNNLTSLRVRCQSVDGLIHVLHRAPNLRYLTCFTESKITISPITTAYLPELQVLHLASPATTLAGFMSFLHFGSQTSVTLQVTRCPDDEDVHTLLSTLQQHGGCTVDNISSLTLTNSQFSPRRMVIRYKNDNEPKLFVVNHIEGFNPMVLQLRGVEHLRLNWIDPLSHKLLEGLHDFPQLTELSIRGAAFYEFVSNLMNGGSDRKTFINLQRLIIWIAPKYYYSPHRENNMGDMLKEAMFNFFIVLRGWDTQDLRLKELYIHEEGWTDVLAGEDGLRPFFKAKYQKVVGQLVWSELTTAYVTKEYEKDLPSKLYPF